MAEEMHSSSTAIWRRKRVQEETGYSRSTIYEQISRGLFVHSVPLGPRAVGFPARDVAALCAARIAGASDDSIRALVVKLEAARKHLSKD